MARILAFVTGVVGPGAARGTASMLIHTRPTFEPAKADYSSETRRLQFASDCVVVDAVALEPVS